MHAVRHESTAPAVDEHLTHAERPRGSVLWLLLLLAALVLLLNDINALLYSESYDLIGW